MISQRDMDLLKLQAMELHAEWIKEFEDAYLGSRKVKNDSQGSNRQGNSTQNIGPGGDLQPAG
jgi:hypothetical protein